MTLFGRRRSLAVALALGSLATFGCATGRSYVLSADYARAMNDSDWHVTQLPPSATPKPPEATGGAASEAEATTRE